MYELMLDTSLALATGAVILILILTVDYLFQKGRKKQRS
jgi:cbb3-type cytochrome oxidase subunit 3